MSYRPDSQSIETPCRKIIEGIEEFETALMERVRSGEWKQSHITDLQSLALELARVKYTLANVAQETW